MTQFLNQSDSDFVKSRFEEEMVHDVRLTLFTEPDLKGLLVPGMDCETCAPTQQLLEEVSLLSEKIQLDVVNHREDRELTESYGVARVPTIVFSRDDESNVKYLGIPAGTEFPVLLEAIINVSSGSPALSEETISFLSSLEEEISIKVFVTPKRPYCPGVASLAHAMAVTSDKIDAEVIEVQEFPELGRTFGVRGVPLTVINGSISFTGAANEQMLVEHLKSAVE